MLVEVADEPPQEGDDVGASIALQKRAEEGDDESVLFVDRVRWTTIARSACIRWLNAVTFRRATASRAASGKTPPVTPRSMSRSALASAERNARETAAETAGWNEYMNAVNVVRSLLKTEAHAAPCLASSEKTCRLRVWQTFSSEKRIASETTIL
jgi:hypothetical protein